LMNPTVLARYVPPSSADPRPSIPDCLPVKTSKRNGKDAPRRWRRRWEDRTHLAGTASLPTPRHTGGSPLVRVRVEALEAALRSGVNSEVERRKLPPARSSTSAPSNPPARSVNELRVCSAFKTLPRHPSSHPLPHLEHHQCCRLSPTSIVPDPLTPSMLEPCHTTLRKPLSGAGPMPVSRPVVH